MPFQGMPVNRSKRERKCSFERQPLFTKRSWGFLPPPHQQAGVPPNFLLSLLSLWPLPHPWTNRATWERGSSEQAGRVGAAGIKATPPVALGTRHVGYVGPTATVGVFAHEHNSPARQLSGTPGIRVSGPGADSQSRHRHRELSVTQDDYSNRGNDTFPSVIFYRPEQL